MEALLGDGEGTGRRSSLAQEQLALDAPEHPILDMAAGNVVTKYQQSTCEQLWEARGKPKTAQQQEMITMLRNNPALRTEFINKIAAPVANKMFECGLIP